jgi:hypothetical protein
LNAIIAWVKGDVLCSKFLSQFGQVHNPQDGGIMKVSDEGRMYIFISYLFERAFWVSVKLLDHHTNLFVC